ncbi:MAG: AAA family ATPase [Anaerolineae bacterium]|nr:AAA family ATPase [Anaerolineae bacterium]
MRCPRCRAENPSSARFCMQCGAPLPRRCPHCGAAAPAGARFCMACGHALGGAAEAVSPDHGDDAAALTGELRPASIILADVKGSTALAEQVDTETWVGIMNQVFQILGTEIYRYGGEIDQYRGDGLVAFFGVPVAHEDDPERAVLAALAMQEAIQMYARTLAETHGVELLLRVGVNTGEVIAASVGDRRQHREDTAMGRAIALAARMETAAEPGTVLVTADTYRLVAPLFEWRALGEIAAKGVSQPVAVYRPLVPKASVGKLRGIAGLESPLVGRQAEVRAMQQAVERLRAGVGGIVTLVGEAGIGKSRLVAEIKRWTTRGGEASPGKVEMPPSALQWIEGRCLSYTASTAYRFWLDTLRVLLDVPADAPPAATRAALEGWLRTWCAGCYDQVYVYLCRLLALPLSEEQEATLRVLGAAGLKDATFAAVRAMLEGAAQNRPLVIVCEDLHWADPTSLGLLASVLPLVDRVALLLICVFRPETAHGSWQVKEVAARTYGHCHVDLTLDALSIAESETLVGNLLRIEALPGELRQRILDHAEGNPFFVEEILRALMDGGALAYDESSATWRAVGSVAEIVLPDTLHGVVMARIDRLPSKTRRVLQWASVLGRIFTRRLLEAVVQDGDALDEHLLVLRRSQLIRERARLPEREYIFKHHLTQEAAYNGLLRRERRACHRRVAEALEHTLSVEALEQLDLLAHHWERAEVPDKAIPYLLRAGDGARLAYANEEAIATYRRVLALVTSPAGDRWRLDALNGLGLVYAGMGRVDEAESTLREAIALARALALPARQIARLYDQLADVLFWQGRYEPMRRTAQEGLALIGHEDRSVEAVMLTQKMAVAHGMLGDQAAYREHITRIARYVRDLPYEEALRPVYETVIEVYLDAGETEVVREWCHALEDVATVHRDLRARAGAFMREATAVGMIGDLVGLIAGLERALDAYLQIGDRRHQCWCGLRLTEAFLSSGDLRGAEGHVSELLRVAEAVGLGAYVGFAHLLGGMVHLCRSEWARAREAFQEAVTVFGKTRAGDAEPAWFEYIAIYLLGRVYLGEGHVAGAFDRFQDALACYAMGGTWPLFLVALLDGLEETCPDLASFREICHPFRAAHPGLAGLSLAQLYLEPARVSALPAAAVCDDLADLSPDWTWHDVFGDCALVTQGGVEVRAANGRDLWRDTVSAPRVSRMASGDLVAQTVCGPIRPDSDRTSGPAMGGVHVWRDKANYLRLDRGVYGRDAISLVGRIDGRDAIVGRGRLPAGDGGRVTLRLERQGAEVRAYCSADGVRWFCVGHVRFQADDPLQVGVHAVGLNLVSCTIYPGAHVEGTAICFDSFALWPVER